jgi:hypothetical protein
MKRKEKRKDDRQLLHQGSPLELSVEALEFRTMLAGNIRVLVNNAGDVTIKGDGKSNHVEVSQDVSGDIVIRGTEDTFGQATGIKEGRDILSEVVLDATNGTFSGKLTVSMGGGNDFVILRDITIDGDFNYKPGGKSDSLGFFQSTANGLSVLKTGSGNDYMNFVDATFRGDIDAVTGGGVDFIGMSNFALDSGRTANFNTGGGGDVIYLEDSIVDGNLAAQMGGLIDTIYVAEGTTLNGRIDVDMGNLFDLLAIENNVDLDSATLNLDGGKGGFGYQNKLFLYSDSPYRQNPPAGIVNFEADVFTIAGTSTTRPTLSGTLTKWVVDDYYDQSPSANFDVVDVLVAANLARGFDYADLPRNDGPAPDPGTLANQLTAHLESEDYYFYQKIFVKAAFETEIETFDWADYSG